MDIQKIRMSEIQYVFQTSFIVAHRDKKWCEGETQSQGSIG